MSKNSKAFLLSVLVVAICYANSLPNDFVMDDIPLVARNTSIQTIDPIQFISSPYAGSQFAGIYRPFTIFSLSLDHALWQAWPPGYRTTNLLVHALNGWLVFLLVESLVGGLTAPIATMLIYIAHPVHTEAVISIVGRSELFAALFFFSAWLCFRRGRTLWTAVLFFLGLLSKENTIMLPAVLALDLWLEGGRPKVMGAWKKLAATVSVAAAYLVLRFMVLGGIGIPKFAQYMGGELTPLERWMTSGRVFIQYLRLMFAPIDIAGDYDFNAVPIATIANWDAWLGLLLVLAMVIGAFLYRHRYRTISLGLLFSITVLIPVSNWIVPISVLMAERFLYLPLFGMALVGGITFAGIRPEGIRRVIAVGYLSAAIVLCIAHDYIWRNNFTFYVNMVRVVPNSAKGRLGYGFALLEAGRQEDAQRELQAGLQIIPNSPALLSTLAMARMEPNSCDAARPLLEQALAIDPKHSNSLHRMADCLFREGQVEKAELMYRRAIENTPFPDPLLLFMWGRSLEATGQTPAAITAFQRASIIEPGNLLFKQKLATLSH